MRAFFHRTGTAAQIRHHVSTAFSSVDGLPEGRGPGAFVGNQGPNALMLTQMESAGLGSQLHRPVLV